MEGVAITPCVQNYNSFDFFTSILTVVLLEKFCANIDEFNLFFNSFIDKASHVKRYDILHNVFK
jgi:hypothetical protein